jgi:hypothetical protein
MRYLIWLIIISLCTLSFGLTDEIVNFSDYMKNINTLSVYSKKIPKISLLKKLILVKDEKCEYQITWNNYVLSPICLLRKEFPNVPYKTIIDKIRSDLDWFNEIYNDSSKNFIYESTIPLFQSYKSFMPKSDRQKYLLASLQQQWKKISIPEKYIYYEKSKEFWFFVVRKDLSLLKPCTKQNYKVALNSFDNFILSPWKTINLNEYISYLPWYCKWTWPKNLMFYGWVCWFASQLFRTSLINPDIEIVKRSWHSVWLTAYYSDYIYWDDAAIYQNNKQFEIKNNSDKEIYFKVLDKWEFNYFVAIMPEKSSKWVNINKVQIWDLSAQVIKETYDMESWKIKNNQVFDSRYDSKNDAVR